MESNARNDSNKRGSAAVEGVDASQKKKPRSFGSQLNAGTQALSQHQSQSPHWTSLSTSSSTSSSTNAAHAAQSVTHAFINIHATANDLFKLGVSYVNGDGVPQSNKKAIKYWTLAAIKGHHLAVQNLHQLCLPSSVTTKTADEFTAIVVELRWAYKGKGLAYFFPGIDAIMIELFKSNLDKMVENAVDCEGEHLSVNAALLILAKWFVRERIIV